MFRRPYCSVASLDSRIRSARLRWRIEPLLESLGLANGAEAPISAQSKDNRVWFVVDPPERLRDNTSLRSAHELGLIQGDDMENHDVNPQGEGSVRFAFTKETLRTLYGSVQRPADAGLNPDTQPTTGVSCVTTDNCCCCVDGVVD